MFELEDCRRSRIQRDSLKLTTKMGSGFGRLLPLSEPLPGRFKKVLGQSPG